MQTAQTTNFLIDGIDYYIHPEKYQRRGSSSSQKRTTTTSSSNSSRSSSSSASTRPSSGQNMQNSNSASQLSRGGTSNIGVPPPRQNPTASGLRKLGTSGGSTNSNSGNVDSYTAANNIVRGNRVRGGHSAPHQPSSKAMMRYQIPPPVSAAPQPLVNGNNAAALNSPPKMMVLSPGADRKIVLDGDDDEDKTFKAGHKLAKDDGDEDELEMPRDDAKDSFYASIPPRSNIIADSKQHFDGDDDKYDVRDSKDEISAVYEEDFEQFDDDGQLDVIDEEDPGMMDDVTQRYSYETPAVSSTGSTSTTQEEESVDVSIR